MARVAVFFKPLEPQLVDHKLVRLPGPRLALRAAVGGHLALGTAGLGRDAAHVALH